MPGLEDVNAVLFDLDDTLVDRQRAYTAFYRSLYDRTEAINEEVSWPDAKEFFWSLSPDNATDPRQAFKAIQERWPSVEGHPDQHYHNYFKGIIHNMRPLPGSFELIESLNSSGTPWGVVTNGGEYQIDKVRVTGMEEQIPFVIATELHGANKPDPAPYLHALRLLEMNDADAGRVLFVGDNPHTDIVGAQGVGMQTAWVRMGREFPGHMTKPGVTIDDISELHELIGL